ncbi:hypothetical protein D7030_03400 [Flavobacteriaceae bacterium AU392]|nr:hypothetical protein D1817_09875 [Flavobacteriaceae bacterium]RKM86156.1 hypothetical protein D7030_03400 [Flavobacteriaceae bacterium AU392]
MLLALWALIIYLGYATFMSVYGEIKFNKLKDDRYAKIIPSLIDIRDSQLAHRTVTGRFESNFDNLIKFIDTAQFTLTQRRDTTVLDEEATRRFRVDQYKSIIVIDTLGYKPVKDSLFKGDSRYKTMMNVPVGKPGAKFELKSGFIEQNGIQIPVFEAKVLKSIILHDQPEDFVIKENQVISVDQVNGNAIIVGSMEEVNTNGNWPKNYSSKQ